MGLFSRRRQKKAALVAHQEAQTAAIELAPRLERAIMTLAVHSQQMDDRLRNLEDRLIAHNSRMEQLPSQADVLAVRVHSAQTLTELAGISLELRSEMLRMRDEQREQWESIMHELQESRVSTTPETAPPTPTTPATQPETPVTRKYGITADGRRVPAALLSTSNNDIIDITSGVNHEPTLYIRPDAPEFTLDATLDDDLSSSTDISWGPRTNA